MGTCASKKSDCPYQPKSFNELHSHQGKTLVELHRLSNLKDDLIKHTNSDQKSTQSEKHETKQKIQEKEIDPEDIMSLQPGQERCKELRYILYLFQECSYFYDEHQIDHCHSKVLEIQHQKSEFRRKHELTQAQFEEIVRYEELKTQGQKNLQKYKKYCPQLIKQVMIEHEDVANYDREINKGGWILKEEQNDMKIYVREEEDNKVGALVEYVTDLPFDVVLSVISEYDLYPQFVPFNEQSRLEKAPARNCRIGYNLNNYPILSKREMYFQGIGYNRLQTTGELFLYNRSIHDQPQVLKTLDFQPTLNKDYVQISYKYFVCKYRPISETQGLIILALHADIGLTMPMFIQEYMIKDFVRGFFTRIIEINKQFKGSIWDKKVQQNPDFVIFFKRSVEKYLKKYAKKQ